MGSGVPPDLTWCDPSAQNVYLVCGIVAIVGVFVAFLSYMLLRYKWPSVMAKLGCFGFSSLVGCMAVAFAFIGLKVADAMIPSLEVCSTTDRHVLPLTVGLVLLPSVAIGAIIGSVWKSK